MTKGTTKRMTIMLAIAGVIVGGVVGFQTFKNTMIAKAITAQSNPPQTVSTIVASATAWQPTLQALGSFSASEQASLSAEVGGLVTVIHFDSGEDVQAGKPLVELNSAPLKAQLAQLEAQVGLAEINLRRDEAQFKLRAVSQSVVDTDKATLKSARAQVDAQKALISQKAIAAPFAGRLGIRRVDLGQYLAPGSAIVTIQKLNPMELDFTVPQAQIDLISAGMTARVETSGVPDQTFEGTITAIEPQIDPATRNLVVRARVPNPENRLLPGMFATVSIDHGAPQQYITVPNAAVTYNPYGATLYVVKESGRTADGKPQLTAEQRFVTTGQTRGDQVAIVDGVKVGETVVTGGQLKLRNGTPVEVNNSVQPANSPNPQVPNS